ncbi:MAG: hypothetical protein K2G03_00125 [Bacilli bacterium]|nr:hypothetical protein [Bacilli bacterium]
MASLKGMIVMMLASQIEIARKRFYANWVKFRGFENIDAEELKRIKELVKITNETLFSFIPHSRNLSEKLEKYLAVMRYLGSTNTNGDLPTYDAKIVFFIEAIDPNLELYKAYLELPVVLKAQIAAEDNLTKKLKLNHMYNNQLSNIESKIRLKAGFYDAKLLSYETKYFKSLRCHDELITNVNHAYFAKFAPIFQSSNKFVDITDKDNDNVVLKAEDYLGKYETNLNTLAFQLLFQPDALGLNSTDEIIIFFILVIDKNLKLLDIYHEESNWDEIRRRALEELGFYNKELVLLEKIYQERFIPNYISWDKKEKLTKSD